MSREQLRMRMPGWPARGCYWSPERGAIRAPTVSMLVIVLPIPLDDARLAALASQWLRYRHQR